MPNELTTFIDAAHVKGLHKKDIVDILCDAGWKRDVVTKSVYNLEVDVPKPSDADRALPPVPAPTVTAAAPALAPNPNNDPIAVVPNLSTRGFEYSIMFASLWASAISLGYILHAFINNAFYVAPTGDQYNYYSYSSTSDYTFPATLLLITLPIFVFLFLRLKRAELADPGLKKDPSRKRLSHVTQFLTFITAVGYMVYFVNSLLSASSGTSGAQSVGELCLHLLVTLVIAGGIFAYYWIEEHRTGK